MYFSDKFCKAQDYMCSSFDSCLDCPAGAKKDGKVVCAFSCVKDAIDKYDKECCLVMLGDRQWVI